MVGLRTGKSLKRRPGPGETDSRPEPILAINELALAAEPSVDDEEFSAEELGIDLDKLNVVGLVEDQGVEATVAEDPPQRPSEEPRILAEDTPPALLSDLAEAAPRLPFLFTEPDGRTIVLFSRSRILPTVRVRLKGQEARKGEPTAEPQAGPDMPAPCRDLTPIEQVDFESEEDLEALMGKLGLVTPPAPVELSRPTEARVPSFGISPGDLVLVEGDGVPAIDAVADLLANGLMGERRTLTYVSTQRDTQQVLRSMFAEPLAFSRAMRDLRLLVVPVYPILRGEEGGRPALLERLTGAPQLYGRDVIVINRMTDFLDKGMDDMQSLSIWPFLRKLTAAGKVVILCAGEHHPAVAAIRSASTHEIAVSTSLEGNAKVEVRNSPQAKPERVPMVSFGVAPDGELRLARYQSGP